MQYENSLLVSCPSLSQITLKSSCSNIIVAFKLGSKRYHLDGKLISFTAPKLVSHNSNDCNECWLIGFFDRCTEFLNNHFANQMGIVSNSLPEKEAIKIEKIKLIEMIINKRNKENNSPFEKGLLFPTKF